MRLAVAASTVVVLCTVVLAGCDRPANSGDPDVLVRAERRDGNTDGADPPGEPAGHSNADWDAVPG